MELLASYSASTSMTHIANQLGALGVMVALAVALYSLVQCYFGYIIFRVILVIQGVVNGIGVGVGIGALICASTEFNVAIIIVSALICAIAGGILAHFLYKFGVFCYFFAIFGLIGLMIGMIFTGTREPAGAFIAAGISGIIGGILGVIFERYFIIWTTAICFGYLAGSIIGSMTVIWLGVVLALAFIITGVIVQLKMTKKRKAAVPAGQPQIPQQYQQPQQIPQQYQQPQQIPRNYQQPQSVPQQYRQTVPQAAPASAGFCEKCGAPLKPGAKFCESCGAAAASPVAAVQSMAMASQPVASVHSVSEIPASAPFAPLNDDSSGAQTGYSEPCAQPQNSSPIFCPSCGSRLSVHGAKFCEVCGSRIEQKN